MTPVATIVIPVFNRQGLVERAVASVLQQKGGPAFEVVVVDDGSFPQIRASASLEDPRVRLVRQANSGAGSARNNGATHARGEVLLFLDSDDEVGEQWLRLMIGAFEDDVGAVCCAADVLADGVFTERINPAPLGAPFQFYYGLFLGGTYAVRRDIFRDIGMFDEAMTASQHMELAIRLTQRLRQGNYRVNVVSESLVRIHKHNGFSIRGDDDAVFRSVVRLLEKHRNTLMTNRHALEKTLSAGGVRAIRAGRYVEGRVMLREAMYVQPTAKTIGRAFAALVPAVARKVWPERGPRE